ncbi:MAG: RNA-binding S4 domain-containing protein [Marinifilaceae bacterium]|jgi:ribosome-associated protein|nr:RNA-binding S4 domain-containing protein [Marinifilaceae bacterium]
MIEFELESEYIELIKLIKLLRHSESGAQAKLFVEDGLVIRNGEVETRKRAKIVKGDIIELFESQVKVV